MLIAMCNRHSFGANYPSLKTADGPHDDWLIDRVDAAVRVDAGRISCMLFAGFGLMTVWPDAAADIERIQLLNNNRKPPMNGCRVAVRASTFIHLFGSVSGCIRRRQPTP